jgi:hypothetical protein
MNPFRVFRRRRKKPASFNPSHNYVSKSVEEYLKQGGKITRIEKVDGEYQQSILNDINYYAGADEYLLGK